MKRKVLSVMLVAAMTASLFAGCGSSTDDSESSNSGTSESSAASGTEDSGSSDEVNYDEYVEAVEDKTITIWVAEATVDVTKEAAEAWFEEQGYEGWTVTVEAVGEGEAAGNMITDVEGGADLYSFAQDQLTRLIAAGALQQITGDYATWAEESNIAGAYNAGLSGDALYAYPMTADNGYFLYYDSSVITDTSTLEGIVEQCEAAGKNFYYAFTSWYEETFFFATGCTLEYETDSDGNYIGSTIDIASDAGVVALNEMIELASSSCYQSGSSVGDTIDAAAVVSGTWDKDAAEKLFGDNFACAMLPTFTGSDGETYQMYSFGGYKLLGIKPQTETGKLYVCLELGKYLTDYDMQMERFEQFGWGPSNLEAAGSDAVTADETLAALNAQLEYSVSQGQYPGDYWTVMDNMGGSVVTGEINADSDLEATLEDIQAQLEALAS